MTYVVGVSSGAFGVTSAEEKMQLAGLFKKAQSSITKGVQFVQLDLESISEFEEPDLKEKLLRDVTENLKISYGIHSETKAFGVEAAELDSAIKIEYERAHKRLVDILKESKRINSKYVLIHSSESDPFPMLKLRTQPADLVDFLGRPFKKFMEENPDLIDWMVKDKDNFIWVEVRGRNLKEYLLEARQEWARRLKELQENKQQRQLTKEELEEKLNDYEKEEIENWKKFFMDTVSSSALHYGPERWAYFLVAKYMERENDYLWNSIIDTSIDFFVARENKTSGENKTRDEWLADKKIEKVNGKWSIDNPNFREEHMLWVPAVSAKYTWGHLNPKDPKFEDPKPTIKKANMPLLFETPMAGRGMEEWLRFANPLQIYHLVKEVNEKENFMCLALALDLEHMLSIRLDPELIFRLMPERAGNFVKVIHAGWPSTLAPAHLPILLGSDQQMYLYRAYYQLRQKGFGKDPDVECYIVFERGGPETFQESVLSLRKIVEYLAKDIKPEDLKNHPDFFGLAIGEIAAEERQRVIIRDHARDPLKGTLSVPEEDYGFLSTAALNKGKRPEEWKKEELR